VPAISEEMWNTHSIAIRADHRLPYTRDDLEKHLKERITATANAAAV
jgi:hypothetical protein